MPTDTETLLLRLEADNRAFQKAMLGAAGAADRAAERIERRFAQQNQRITRDFQNFRNGIATTFAALGVGLVVRDVTQLGDVWIRVGNKLAFAGVEASNMAAVQQVIADIAVRTNTELESTAELFSRMYRASAELGVSQERVLAVTELVSKALAGAAPSERASAVRQFGQGLGSGRFQGDELRSLLENAQPIAQAIAREFGVTVGQLKELGAQGELVAGRVLRAIESAGPQIEAAFARTTRTVSDAFTNLQTRAAQYLGTTESTSNAQRALIGLIQDTANNFDALADAAILAAAAIGGSLAGVAMGHTIKALQNMALEMGHVGARSASLRALTAFLGGPWGVALGIAGASMAVLATQTNIFASSAEAAARANDTLRGGLEAIANLELVSDDQAARVDAVADATGNLADLTERAARNIDDLASSSADAESELSTQERLTRALATAQLEQARATLEQARAAQQARLDTLDHQEFFAGFTSAFRPSDELEREFRERAEQAERIRGLIGDFSTAITGIDEGHLRLRQGATGAAGGTDPDADPQGGRASRQSIADLEQQASLTLARLRHETARVQQLEDAESLEKRTLAYVSAGAALADARVRAEGEVRAEREAMNAEALRSYELSRLQDQADLARIQNNVALADTIIDQVEIQQRMRTLMDDHAKSQEEALALATEFVELRREALEIDRQHQIELRDLNTALEIARTAGDERAERAIERRLDLESRIAELRELGVGEGAAVTQAQAEVEALERADLRGRFREWFGDGVVAALEGDLGELFQNWAAERFETALRDALDRVADVLFDAFDGVVNRVLEDGAGGLGDVLGSAANSGLAKLAADAGAASAALKGQLATAVLQSAAKEAASAASKSASAASVVSANAFLASSAKLAAIALQQLAVSGGGKSKGGILGDILGALAGGGKGLKFGGGKAVGGPIDPGFIYQVHKDEFIAPRMSGFVIPKGIGGGGATTIQYVDRSTRVFNGVGDEWRRQIESSFAQDLVSRRSQVLSIVQDGLNRRHIR